MTDIHDTFAELAGTADELRTEICPGIPDHLLERIDVHYDGAQRKWAGFNYRLDKGDITFASSDFMAAYEDVNNELRKAIALMEKHCLGL